MSRSRATHWTFLGRVPYPEAEALQHAVRERLRRGEGPERLLLLEHPPLFTLGRNAREADVMAGEQWRRRRGIEVFTTDRGGQATYHGPGQLVGYPLVDLAPDRKDVRRYVRDLQEVLVRVLGEYGVSAVARPSPHIGVWVGPTKIASIGVHLSRWLTTHGFALNVSTDLAHFEGIVPCGLPEVRMTSLLGLTGEAPPLAAVAAAVARQFGRVFDREMIAAVPAALPAPMVAGG